MATFKRSDVASGMILSAVGRRVVTSNGELFLPRGFIDDPMPHMRGKLEYVKSNCPDNFLLSDCKSLLDRVDAKLKNWASLVDAAKNGGAPFDEAKERKALVGLSYYAGDLMGYIDKLRYEEKVKHVNNLRAGKQNKGKRPPNRTWAWLDDNHPGWWRMQPKYVLQIVEVEWNRPGGPLNEHKLKPATFASKFSVESRKRNAK